MATLYGLGTDIGAGAGAGAAQLGMVPCLCASGRAWCPLCPVVLWVCGCDVRVGREELDMLPAVSVQRYQEVGVCGLDIQFEWPAAAVWGHGKLRIDLD